MIDKIAIRKRISIALLLALLLCTVVSPSSATEIVCKETSIVETQFGTVEVESVLTVHEPLIRSNTKDADYTQTYKYSGKVIGKVTLFATFGYDGKTAWVSSASGSHTTYNGWTYGNEKITTSGGTATLNAALSHTAHGSIAVNISMTCSPTGQIS